RRPYRDAPRERRGRQSEPGQGHGSRENRVRGPDEAAKAAQASVGPQEGERVTEPAPPPPISQPIPHWPGRLVSLASGKRVWLAGTSADPSPGTSDRELVLCVHGMTG